MASKYREQHYEDVAEILSEHGGYITARVVTDSIVRAFADLFAADNPPLCPNCKVDRKNAPGFECHVDEADAMAWLKENRRAITMILDGLD